MENELNVKVLKNRINSKWRIVIVFVFFGLLALVVAVNLFLLQVLDYRGYKDRALNQYMVETSVSAERGTVYDANMNPVAVSVTVERVFISPVDIKDQKEAVDICKKLSELLDVDYDTIYAKSQKPNRRDETVKNFVEKEDADKVREFIKEYSTERGYTINSIHFAETTKRYYPYGSLAAQTIGFVGTDGDGLLGLEMQYNESLKGESGKIVTSKNGVGDKMPVEYESYIDATNGANIVTTIDMTVQGILEKYLRESYEDNAAGNRVCGAVMNVKTGAVYAIATIPSFDLNSPYELDADSLAILEEFVAKNNASEEEESKKRVELLYKMWTNKVITELYEPGSTFKVMTASMALEEDVVTRNTSFHCGGCLTVAGQMIHCHKVIGHGTVTFEKGLQQSCNPVFMQTAAKVGARRFYYYF